MAPGVAAAAEVVLCGGEEGAVAGESGASVGTVLLGLFLGQAADMGPETANVEWPIPPTPCHPPPRPTEAAAKAALEAEDMDD